MRVALLLPALTEAKSPFFRPVKYALFPPLGLAIIRARRVGRALPLLERVLTGRCGEASTGREGPVRASPAAACPSP